MTSELTTWIIAIAVTVFHFWASRRRPKYWYLGGIVPVLWIGILAFLLANHMIHIQDDWQMVVFPTAILFLIWAAGYGAARRKEAERMKAQDIQ